MTKCTIQFWLSDSSTWIEISTHDNPSEAQAYLTSYKKHNFRIVKEE